MALGEVLAYGCAAVAGAVVVVLLAAWRVARKPIAALRSGASLSQLVGAQVPGQPGEIVVELRSLDGHAVAVTEIDVPREAATRLGLEPPPGFEVMPLTVEPGDPPEMAEFVNDFNAESLRWAGRLEVPADEPILVRFRVADAPAGGAALAFGYERKIGFGGMEAVAHVHVGEKPSEEER